MSSVLSMPLTDPVPPAVDPNAMGGATAQPPAPGAQQMRLGNLTMNPQLPQHPLGAYTDALYEAQVAQLRQEISQRYNDVLQQLGYTGPNGEFVPGTAEIEANKQRGQLTRGQGLAAEQVTQQHQQQGTLFSGLRGTDQARAEYPFASGIADLGVSVPKQLTDLYGQAGGLVNEFTTRHNLMLAEAAQRASANLANNAAAGGTNVTGVGDPAGGFTAPAPLDQTFGTGGTGWGTSGAIGLEGQGLPNFGAPAPLPLPQTAGTPRPGINVAV